jgi:hypothetical protein
MSRYSSRTAVRLSVLIAPVAPHQLLDAVVSAQWLTVYFQMSCRTDISTDFKLQRD